ncbi:Sybindin-like protein [Ceraceosorus guamensis]|uniref:Trafficking protein particle complex subunit n=1 Tax=Ceraceosorus guamensis TaxID=1522189 RepID=A0A316W0K4_9BASI|nr:Sybindin-like protein [Ceraceosorus guamensis]PWN42253.1 Sybindin-like protein [Ceraceosorus guamensis]
MSANGSSTSTSLWIINKAGGLIYQSFATNEDAPKLSANEALILAGTLHGIHAITARINPTALPDTGLTNLSAGGYELNLLVTPTGIKFILLHPPSLTPQAAQLALRAAYEAYADLVMKNPFYTAEMPIRGIGAFDEKIKSITSV